MAGGSIEGFINTADAQARLTYLKAFQPPFGDGYDYLVGASLLRLFDGYTPTQARAMQATFESAAR